MRGIKIDWQFIIIMIVSVSVLLLVLAVLVRGLSARWPAQWATCFQEVGLFVWPTGSARKRARLGSDEIPLAALCLCLAPLNTASLFRAPRRNPPAGGLEALRARVAPEGALGKSLVSHLIEMNRDWGRAGQLMNCARVCCVCVRAVAPTDGTAQRQLGRQNGSRRP